MAIAKREDLVIAYEKYQSNGVEKTNWKNIGEMITFKKEDGSYSKMIKLWTMPGVVVNVFEQKKREQVQKQEATIDVAYPEEEVSLDNIPF